MNVRAIALSVSALMLQPATAWSQGKANVQEAIDVIVLFCVAGGSEYKVTGDAKLEGGLLLKRAGVSVAGVNYSDLSASIILSGAIGR